MTWIFFIPILFVFLLMILLLGGARRRGGLSIVIGLFLLLVLGGYLVFLMRLRADFGSQFPEIVSVQPRQVRPMPLRIAPDRMVAPSTAPAGQTNTQWVDDWTGFTNDTQFQGFRAESSDTCASETESLNEAIRAAARDLNAILRTRPDLSPRRILPNQPDLLMRQVTSALASQEVVAAQFVRTTEKSYGTLWKTYLLIDTSPAKINPIVRRLNQQVSVDRKQTLTAAGSVAATVLVVLLLYAFLNTVTKGYFIWRLRAAVILVLIAGVLAVCSIV